jgi:caffeoyl-CoA O-methyltransferase
LKNVLFCSRSRKTKILSTGIPLVFRGLKFESDAEIGEKGAFFKALKGICMILVEVLTILGLSSFLLAQQPAGLSALDSQVSRFLEEARNTWSDLNVPYEDGKTLYFLVLNGRFKNILEIGTSTGHSTIWLAWAASKTGGKVTTIEINQERYEKALSNFKKAGVASYIDARLADAHRLVPRLQGPYDFIFCDADKDWCLQYFLDLESKISPRGCFTAHNVLWRHDPHIKKFLDYVQGNRGFRTHIEKSSGEGISVSCRVEK